MREFRISEREIWDKMVPIIKAAPYETARNIALASLMADKGIRYKGKSLFGLETPEILPPFEIWWEPSRLEFVIRQGDSAAPPQL